MAVTLSQIKGRISALEKTSSITQALYNISVSKIKATTHAYDHYLKFMTRLNNVVFDAGARVGSHPLINQRKTNRTVYLLITSDRGLAGSYHSQLFKQFLEEVKQYKKDEYFVFVIGRKGYFFALKQKLPMINTKPITNRDDLTTINFKAETKYMQQQFMQGAVDHVVLFYNHYVSTTTQKVKKEEILPIPISKKSIEKRQDQPYFYDAKPAKVLEQASLMYIETLVYGALVDAKLSEYAARVIAMKAATDNAKNAAQDLKLVYNRARQQAITNELIDLVNGTNA